MNDPKPARTHSHEVDVEVFDQFAGFTLRQRVGEITNGDHTFNIAQAGVAFYVEHKRDGVAYSAKVSIADLLTTMAGDIEALISEKN